MSRDSDLDSDDQIRVKSGSGDETELQLPSMEDFNDFIDERENSPEHYTRAAAVKKKAKSSET